jgi:hypothetical protein
MTGAEIRVESRKAVCRDRSCLVGQERERTAEYFEGSICDTPLAEELIDIPPKLKRELRHFSSGRLWDRWQLRSLSAELPCHTQRIFDGV